MHVSQSDRSLLTWWLNTYKENKPHFYGMRKISGTIETDSSLTGWGVNIRNSQSISISSTGSHFGTVDMSHSINTKELLAIKYGIQTYKQLLTDKHFVLKSDSVTALADLRKMGTMKNKFRDSLVKEIQTELMAMNSQLTLSYIHTSQNKIADEYSRVEWSVTTE